MPAAATTTAPASTTALAAASTAGLGRAVPADSDTTEREGGAPFRPRVSAANRAATQSSPATRALALAPPSHWMARTATRVALGATPAVSPAAVAATWVPWPWQSSEDGGDAAKETVSNADHPCTARDASGGAPGGAAPGAYRNWAWSLRIP